MHAGADGRPERPQRRRVRAVTEPRMDAVFVMCGKPCSCGVCSRFWTQDDGGERVREHPGFAVSAPPYGVVPDVQHDLFRGPLAFCRRHAHDASLPGMLRNCRGAGTKHPLPHPCVQVPALTMTQCALPFHKFSTARRLHSRAAAARMHSSAGARAEACLKTRWATPGRTRTRLLTRKRVAAAHASLVGRGSSTR